MSATVDSRESVIRRVFRVGLFLKAAHSLIEVAGALVLYLVSDAAILRFADAVTRHELLRDPRDIVANFVLRTAESFSVGQKSAAALYLLTHGAVKLFLVVMVLREHRWAYPAFMVALALLIAYQSYRIALTGSPWLIVLTVFDLIVLWLTWHEYRFHRAARPAG